MARWGAPGTRHSRHGLAAVAWVANPNLFNSAALTVCEVGFAATRPTGTDRMEDSPPIVVPETGRSTDVALDSSADSSLPPPWLRHDQLLRERLPGGLLRRQLRPRPPPGVLERSRYGRPGGQAKKRLGSLGRRAGSPGLRRRRRDHPPSSVGSPLPPESGRAHGLSLGGPHTAVAKVGRPRPALSSLQRDATVSSITCPGRLQPCLRSFPDQIPLKLRQGCEYVEDEPSLRTGGINRVIETF